MNLFPPFGLKSSCLTPFILSKIVSKWFQVKNFVRLVLPLLNILLWLWNFNHLPILGKLVELTHLVVVVTETWDMDLLINAFALIMDTPITLWKPISINNTSSSTPIETSFNSAPNSQKSIATLQDYYNHIVQLLNQNDSSLSPVVSESALPHINSISTSMEG